MRFFVTGTDTDVGKTRVAAALAADLVRHGRRPTVIKAVQTGLAPGERGDAEEAAALAGCAWRECARFRLPADPWSAALAEGARPLEAAALAAAFAAVPEPFVVEGAGGAAVPLNARETLAAVAKDAGCTAVLAVGMRLGCISHALLTLAYLAAEGVPAGGIVLVDRWRPSTAEERARVVRAVEGRARVLGVLEHEGEAAGSVRAAAPLFDPLVIGERDQVGTRI